MNFVFVNIFIYYFNYLIIILLLFLKYYYFILLFLFSMWQTTLEVFTSIITFIFVDHLCPQFMMWKFSRSKKKKVCRVEGVLGSISEFFLNLFYWLALCGQPPPRILGVISHKFEHESHSIHFKVYLICIWITHRKVLTLIYHFPMY